MRLAKYLAHAGVASRRASEKLIAEGRVTLNGKPAENPADDVSDADEITVNGRRVGAHEGPRSVYLVNKPAGVVSTAHDTHGRQTIVELVPAAGRRLYPVGRLDAETTGLILLTDDGDLAHRMTHPSFEVPKVYRARVRNPPVREAALRAMREGIELEDGRTSPARVRVLAPAELELTIHEGRKRQVRRMCEAVGHRVEALERVSFGSLRLGDLPPGAHRRLTGAEVERLRSWTPQRSSGRGAD